MLRSSRLVFVPLEAPTTVLAHHFVKVARQYHSQGKDELLVLGSQDGDLVRMIGEVPGVPRFTGLRILFWM